MEKSALLSVNKKRGVCSGLKVLLDSNKTALLLGSLADLMQPDGSASHR